MTPRPEKPDLSASASKDERKLTVRTRTPRPDELTRETLEFIAAVDGYKRRHIRSFLNDFEILTILLSLGYQPPSSTQGESQPTEEHLQDFAEARQLYRKEQGRLFPSWSEVFALLMNLGYRHDENDNAA